MDMTVDKLGVKELDALIREAKARKAKLAKRKPLAAVRARLFDYCAAGFEAIVGPRP